jgi:hypothetical protein
MKERRLAFRYPLILPVGVPTLEGILQGRTRDISAWGVYFTLDRGLELGTRFIFSIMLSEPVTGGTRVSVNGQATVVRVEEEEDNALKHVGIAALIENREIVRLGESRA